MRQINWRDGFKIESDGTCVGTKIYDADGEWIMYLKRFIIDFDAHKDRPRITHVEWEGMNKTKKKIST